MTRQRRKKMHYGDTHLKRRWRTKSRTKDLDQVCDSRVSSIITFKDFLAYLCDLMLSNECNEFHTINEINEDLRPENCESLINQEVDYDKPGSAQYYCVHCARYFISQNAQQDHFRTKTHKRRLKALEIEPYTIEESERAAGVGSWVQPKKRKIETQKPLESEPSEKTPTIDLQ